MNSIRTAIADSIANPSRPVFVHGEDIEAAVAFIQRNFVDVDFDPFPDRITIFGADPSVPVSGSADEDENTFVLNLMRPVILTANPFNE